MMPWWPTKTKRVPDIVLSACSIMLISASVSMGGCCSEHDDTACFDWDEPATCPPPDVAAPKLVGDSGTVNSSGTLWPAHDYLINGVRKTEPAQCCYEVTRTVCTKWEFH